MVDLERRFESLDRLDAPELWTDIEHQADDRLSRLAGGPKVAGEKVATRGVLVAAGVAVVILVVVGLATWLLVGAEQAAPPVITQDTTPTSLPTTVPEATIPQTTMSDATVPVPAEPTDTWAPVPDPDGVFTDGTVRDVSVGSFGFVAVGVEQLDTQGAIWTSSDGISWARVPDPDGLFASASIEGIAEGGPGLVAVGADWTTRHTPQSAVWTSSDGWSWTKVPDDPAVFGSGLIEAVTAWGPDLVAVGGFCEPLETGCAWVTAAWISSDGSSWSRLASGESGLGESGMLRDLAVGPSGLVAVGASWPGGNGAMWVSADGMSWTRVPHNEALFGGDDVIEILTIAAGSDGLVAVGSSMSMEPLDAETCSVLTDGVCGEHIVVWTSTNGTAWERVTHNSEIFGSYAASTRAGDIVSRDAGYVLVGVRTLGGAKHGTVWTSINGTNWTLSVPSVELGDELHAINSSGTGLLAFGRSGDNEALYVARPDDLP